LHIPPVDLTGVYRHRAVEEDVPPVEIPFIVVLAQHIKYFLAAPDGEGGYEYVTAVALGAADDLTQLLHGRVP
jgi:hypothetical protein